MKACAILTSLLVLWVPSSALLSQDQLPRFRAGVDAVVVDVSVLEDGRPIRGLTLSEFELRDSGVLQVLDDLEFANDGLDVTVLVETGPETESRRDLFPLPGSTSTGIAERISGAIEELRAILLPVDHLRLLAFDHEIRTVPVSIPFGLIRRGGSVIFDAILVAAMQRTEPGRRRVVVVLTQGIDHHSLVPTRTAKIALARTSAVVYIVAISTGLRSFASAGTSEPQHRIITNQPVGGYDGMLREVTDLTGGRLISIGPNDSFIDQVRKAVDEHRGRYWLRYRPTNVAATGWHPITVKLRRHGRFEVRARAGYWR